MSLRPTLVGDVPASTATIAHAVIPRDNPYLLLRDRLGTIFTDAQFAPLFARCGQPAKCPWRLALVTLLQFAENLSDRQSADAVRSRIDWKYLLGLELTDLSFDASVLREFCSRLLTKGAEEQMLDTLLALCREQKLWSAMASERAIVTCRKSRRSGGPTPTRLVVMIIRCLRPPWLLVRQYGCARSRLLNSCGKSGPKASFSSTMLHLRDLRLAHPVGPLA
ncbi:transposase [Microvirga splendida]|uniref:transposase n=1 Tax=Microvirga splendida TaxID=2795727 RepID=UPI001FEF29FD|nr:transposase [Microvirga splendida]